MSHSNSSKVGEIFTAAGAAFNKLGELIMTLNSVGESSPSSGKWTAQEMDMLKSSVKTFGTDLERINESVKSRSITQIKAIPIKRKSFEDPSVGVKKQMTTLSSIKPVPQDKMRSVQPKSADITLNMLNAMEPEVDVDGLTSTTKLEYDSSDAS
ncbi:hypothetical protein JTE90_022892 [Oedothorax gibbosus]|uniref:Chromatin complexes subunit BAP18 n=1 Tax=Oedothorax gibbosus TaxID=931172 RepID=A0AAV6UTG9_9ARAC|nr:hypothetical protein JTE90_022892 [Oedothorax gibbosus]